jgi:protein TonB
VAAARIRFVARLGGPGSALSPFVVGSLCIHMVFVAALVLLPSLRSRKPFPDHPIVVDLVAGPRVAARAQPPAPAPEETPPEGVRLETRKPPQVTPAPVEPKKKREPEEKPRPTPRRTTEPTDPAPGAASGATGPAGGGSITAALEVGDVQLAWYSDSVQAALYGQWRRPILSGLTESIEVRITFEILRDGGIRGLDIDESSGVAVFDRAALRAVSDAAPLPPLPGNWREPTMPATFVFVMYPE